MYGQSLECIRTISAPAGRLITFEFSELDLEGCCDFVYLLDGTGVRTRYGGQLANVPRAKRRYVAKDNMLQVRFQTNNNNASHNFHLYKGFNARFGCLPLHQGAAQAQQPTAPSAN